MDAAVDVSLGNLLDAAVDVAFSVVDVVDVDTVVDAA